MTEAATVRPNGRRRNRIMLVAIVVVFVLPAVLARYYYRSVVEVGPDSTTNNGVLIRPARPLGDVALLGPDGQSVDAEILLGRWTLVHVQQGHCEDACRRSLYNSRQTRLALNKEAGRVQRLLLKTDGYPMADLHWLREQDPALLRTTAAQAELERLLQALQVEETGPDVGSGQRTYLVDPHGNLMMWYSAEQDPKGMLRDLRKLLKVSQIG